jgi:hypothetical protein
MAARAHATSLLKRTLPRLCYSAKGSSLSKSGTWTRSTPHSAPRAQGMVAACAANIGTVRAHLSWKEPNLKPVLSFKGDELIENPH